MEDVITRGYYYGVKFSISKCIVIRELLDNINNYKVFNVISCIPADSKYVYVLYNENLIKRGNSIDSFKNCNHWFLIRERLDHIFDFMIKKHIKEYINHPRKIYYFEHCG